MSVSVNVTVSKVALPRNLKKKHKFEKQIGNRYMFIGHAFKVVSTYLRVTIAKRT